MSDVTVQKKIFNIVFDEKDKYLSLMAKEYARNGRQVIPAFREAFKEIEKVRSSNELGRIEFWKIAFDEYLIKKNPDELESQWIDEFNRFKEVYELSPLDCYVYYVEINQETQQPISRSISTDPILDIVKLINLHHFFTVLQRDKFVTQIKLRIKEEYESIQCRPEMLNELKKQLERVKKKQDIETDEILDSCLTFNKKTKIDPNQLKMKLPVKRTDIRI